jgi:UPF0755 protein
MEENELKAPPRIGFIGLLIRGIFYLSVPVLVGIAVYAGLHHAFMVPLQPGNTAAVLFEVPPQATLKSVAKRLEEQGLVAYWWSVAVLARLNGKDKNIVAGEFEISAGQTPQEILNKLISGKTYKRRVTIREGMTVAEIPALFEAAGLMKATDLETVLHQPELLREAGITVGSFEGYLFPDTYFFSRPLTPRDAVLAMVKEGNKRWTPEFQARSDELKLTRHAVLTLASIIEKESGNVVEQPRVSSVFHNRLRINMRLQSDPTVIYGMEQFSGNITKADLETPTPYNTYTENGLPPGPIANPGDSAIRAALYPQETTFLYFVSDGNGAHVFSSNLQDHNRAVLRYQKISQED